MRTLVLGGIRSGKSAIAESAVLGAVRRAAGTAAGSAAGSAVGSTAVTYVATGPRADDAEWAARIAAHRARRPATWTTLETTDLPAALGSLRGPVLVDCLGTWLTAQLDDLGAWDGDRTDWEPLVAERIGALADAVQGSSQDLVIVTNEVGLTLVPDNRAGRIFADWLGLTNQRVADACDTILLVVAGQTLTVKQP